MILRVKNPRNFENRERISKTDPQGIGRKILYPRVMLKYSIGRIDIQILFKILLHSMVTTNFIFNIWPSVIVMTKVHPVNEPMHTIYRFVYQLIESQI